MVISQAMKPGNSPLAPSDLRDAVQRLFAVSAAKIHAIEAVWQPEAGSPVFTVGGKYASRGWTEWTQGFQFGSALLQFDATGEESFLEIGRRGTLDHMAPHLTHTGVHDHGFNNISTYGNLLRLMNERRIPENQWERRFYELALKCSGAVQAARWTSTTDGGGFIYSFNGPHSLFIDTIRSLRSLAVAHRLGHALMGENDCRISLLDRLARHAEATARHNVYYGEGRDLYDIRGRVAHESIFNVNDGLYRCPSSQQGYSPFSTWTRGLAWAICGFAEQLEFISAIPDEFPNRAELIHAMRNAAEATADYYIENSAADGIPYWDTGAPGLARLGDWRSRPAEPSNQFEPVDSSAASIAAQGLLRLGHWLAVQGEDGGRYWQAGLLVARTLLREPYLSTNPSHQGLILHSIYHRPNAWDKATSASAAPNGESSMWGDYHARELALYLLRIIESRPYLIFWSETPK